MAAIGWTERAQRIWHLLDLATIAAELTQRLATPVRLGAARWSYPATPEESLLDSRAYRFALVHPGKGLSVQVAISGRMGAAIALRLLGSDEQVVEPLSEPSAFDQALVVHLGGEILAALKVPNWQVSNQRTDYDMPGPAVSVDLWLGDDVHGTVWVYWPTKSLAGLAMPTKRNVGSPAEDLPLEAVLDLRPQRVTLAELRTWSVGCVLLPDELQLHRNKGISGQGVFRVLGTQCAWECAFNGEEISVTAKLPNELTASVHTPSTDATHTKINWEHLANAPVELQIELARFTFPLARLAELEPGTIIRAHQPVGSVVRLRAQDKVVAVGELVDVDGEIGIRITEVM